MAGCLSGFTVYEQQQILQLGLSNLDDVSHLCLSSRNVMYTVFLLMCIDDDTDW